MRRAGGAWALALCVAASGCAHDPFAFLRPGKKTATVNVPARTVGGFGDAFGNALDVEAAPGLHVESVIYERPLGDTLLNRDIWSRDAAQIPAATRVLLEENGFRVAVIGGNLPPDFLRMLESGEGAISPQAMTFGTRTETVVPTVGPIAECAYRVRAELAAEREPRTFTAVHGGFRVQPERTDDGRVKLRCEPLVQHGERQDFIRPAADATGFTLRSEVPHEAYPALGFDLTLDPNDYLVIGWRAADEGTDRTLASTMFCVEAKGESRQRVLVIRAGYRGDSPSPLRVSGTRSIAAQVRN